MKIAEKWIREHLPEECRNEPIDCFGDEYLDGLTVMGEISRGGPIGRIYTAVDEEDLLYWQFEQVCYAVGKADHSKKWRYYRDHCENGVWYYIENHNYDYDAIEDRRLTDFERYLYNLSFGLPKERWQQKIAYYLDLLNSLYKSEHWDYDLKKRCFIEISASPLLNEEVKEDNIIRTVG